MITTRIELILYLIPRGPRSNGITSISERHPWQHCTMDIWGLMQKSLCGHILRIRLFPPVWELDYGSGLRYGLECIQRIHDDPPVTLHVFWFAEHASPGEFHDQSPRRPGILHPFRAVAHGYGWNPRRLHHPLNQTDRLMAFRSNRYRK